MKILVVVDMQHDFIDGALGTPEARAIVPNVKKKVEESVTNGDFILYTRDTHYENYLDSEEGRKLPVEHCIKDTKGWMIPVELFPDQCYDKWDTVDKFTFGEQRLPRYIRDWLVDECVPNEQVSEIELVGLCTDICVVSNALILKSHFYDEIEISVDATCCAGVTPATHEAALKTMEMCQINVRR